MQSRGVPAPCSLIRVSCAPAQLSAASSAAKRFDWSTPASPPLPSGRLRLRLCQALLEEVEHLIERIARRVTRLVDEMLGHDGMRDLRNLVRIRAFAVLDLDGDEAVAEYLAEVIEPRFWHEPIAR